MSTNPDKKEISENISETIKNTPDKDVDEPRARETPPTNEFYDIFSHKYGTEDSKYK